MGLDDGAADRQSDSHSIVFRCVESFKESGGNFRWEADSHIPNAKAYSISFFIMLCSDEQLSRAVLDTRHRVRSISQQVENDLLELNTIACDRRQVPSELRLQDHSIPLQIAQGQCNHLFCGLVQIQRLQCEWLLGE